MSHFITKCDCGTVISQCRCFSKEKIVNVLAKGCDKCKSTTASVKQSELQHALEDYFAKEAAKKGHLHECGKCFKWRKCECVEDAVEKEAGKEPQQLAKAIKEEQTGEETDQTAVALKKLHKGEQEQLAVEIKKKHVNQE